MPQHLLAIETATSLCSVAWATDGEVVGQQVYRGTRLHARLVTALAQQLADNLGLAIPSLAAVAVSAGPGSYTGLRIGMSAAQGLAFGLDIPLVPVPTLLGLASRVVPLADAGAIIVPLLDARRAEVFAAAYELAQDGRLRPIIQARSWLLTQRAFEDLVAQGPVWFAGDGLAKARQAMPTHPNAHWAAGIECLAEGLIPTARQQLAEHGHSSETLGQVPEYLKAVRINTPNPLPGR
jgi:tRNA threonylcarbamoyladenosine biosynthesis protein TsaB